MTMMKSKIMSVACAATNRCAVRGKGPSIWDSHSELLRGIPRRGVGVRSSIHNIHCLPNSLCAAKADMCPVNVLISSRPGFAC